MFNVLSGLQAGSHSAVLVSRNGSAGLVKGAVVMTDSTANHIVAADNSTLSYPMVEWVFEDLTTQTSGKYTTIYGSFEGETDQYSGSPAIGAFLKPGTSTTAGLMAAATLPTGFNLVVAKVIDSYSLPVNPTMLAGVGGVATNVVRFRAK